MKKQEQIDYLSINKKLWNKKTAIHFQSKFYDVEGFLKGDSSLNSIELNLLGNVSGKNILHLQCHFGQDTISLQRLGASVTGVDFSDEAITSARLLAEKANQNAKFVCCDIYNLPHHLNQQFDIVFTSYGTIGWLPDLNKWAEIISQYLKTGGKLIFIEFHPVVWMFDNHFKSVEYSYFNTGPIIEKESGTYADRDADIQLTEVGWNHGLSEVFNSLIKHGLEINSFDEFDYSPYNCFREMICFEPEKYRIKHLDNKIPMVYAIVATKKV